MRWCRTDPVQEVDALIMTGDGARELLISAMARKSAPFQALAVVHGTRWAALFAASPEAGTDPVLPRLAGATPLYRAHPDWWFPVGMRLDVPDHVHDALLVAFAEHHGFAPPAIVLPRPSGEGDVHLVRHPMPFGEWAAMENGA
jgi:hypothetical protein